MPRAARVPKDLGFGTDPAPPPAISPLFASATGTVATAIPPGELAIERLLDNPFQPANRGDETTLAELAAVMERQGFHGQLLARPAPQRPGYYELAFGHQRREAARRAGLTSVPVKIEDLSDRQMAEQVVTENIHRLDLDALDEAHTYQVMKTALTMTDDEIARAVGKERSYVTKRLNLLKAPEDVQELVRARPDSFSAAAHLRQIEDSDLRGELIAGFREGKYTTHDIAEVRRNPQPAPAPAPVVAPPTATEPRAVTPPAPSPTVAAIMAPEAAEARAGRVRLAGLVSSLNRYKHEVARRDQISLAEYTHLQELRSLVEKLLDDYAPVEGIDG